MQIQKLINRVLNNEESLEALQTFCGAQFASVQEGFNTIQRQLEKGRMN